MVSVDEAVIVKMKKNNLFFEVLVDPEKALELKKGNKIDFDTLLAYPVVYHDAKKGYSVSEEDMQKNFGTTDVYTVARMIILKGNMQFTTEQKRKFIEDKTKEIANIISRRGINPQTNAPHPPQRILFAMEKGGVRIDPFLDAEVQISGVIKSIKPLLPIKFENVTIQIIISAQYTGKTYSVLKGSLKDFQEQWLNDGSLQITVNVPAGMQADLLQKIGDVTKGNFKSKIIQRVNV